MTELLNKAIAAYAVSEVMDRPNRRALAMELNEFGMLSKRQLASIVRLPPKDLFDLEKRDNRGGRLNPDTLSTIEAASNAEDEAERWDLVYRAYRDGTSAKTIAVLLDLSVDTIWNRIRALRAAAEAARDE